MDVYRTSDRRMRVEYEDEEKTFLFIEEKSLVLVPLEDSDLETKNALVEHEKVEDVFSHKAIERVE